MMQRQCTQCSKTFQITADDLTFYQRLVVPEPTLCPDCRMQRRLAWRNERNFYQSQCRQCNKPVISQYNPAKQWVVYCETCYWADNWSGQDYARPFDFSKTFGEQFQALNRAVPHMAMIHTNSTNAEYTHLAANNNNSYMLIESSNNENCNYSYWLQNSTDCFDSSYCSRSQLLYESDDLLNSYRVLYSRSSANCADSYFLLNCSNVINSFGCVNLRNKQYCVFNQQFTKDAYETFLANLHLAAWSGVQQARQLFNDFAVKQPRKFAEINHAQSCTGNYINRANNCRRVFHCYEADAVAYSEHVWRAARDIMDCSTVGINAELVYDAINTAINVYNMRFTNQCWNQCSNVDYSMYCNGLTNGFGCCAIKKGSNLILNQSYSVKEYTNLHRRIITHMKEAGEWGHFLSPKYSPFGYNETVAAEQFPLDEVAARQQGFHWAKIDNNESGQTTITWDKLPDSITDFSTDNVSIVVACQRCQKNYRIIPAEAIFYRQLHIPLPRWCPTCRQHARIILRNPNTLWQRQCMCTQPDHAHAGRCTTEFETTYSPERKELLYCEWCYQKEIY